MEKKYNQQMHLTAKSRAADLGVSRIKALKTYFKKGCAMINLGDEVKDSVSGFKGIAVAKHTYLQGCDRVSVQPSIDKEGKLPEAQTFDEPQLETIKQAKVKRQAPSIDPGGPEKYRDSGKIIG